jgi:hypothetical protein
MGALEIVKKAISDIENGAIDPSTYTDDMTLSGPVPMPLNREQFVGLMRSLHDGIPDWNFHASNHRVEGDTVHMDVQISGTQTRTLPGLMPGMPDFPASNKHFALGTEQLAITLRGDKACAIVATVPPGGGVLGMLAQLGVPMPH